MMEKRLTIAHNEKTNSEISKFDNRDIKGYNNLLNQSKKIFDRIHEISGQAIYFFFKMIGVILI